MFAADDRPGEFKKGKKRRGDLRIDHSKVHFENERLADALHTNLNQLASHQHKQWMSRGSEIEEIRRTVQDYKTLQSASRGPSKRKDLPLRPHTSSAYLCKREKRKQVGISVRITSTDNVDGQSSDDSDNSSFIDDDPFSQKRVKSAPAANFHQQPSSRSPSKNCSFHKNRPTKPFNMTPPSTKDHIVKQTRSTILSSAGTRSGFRSSLSMATTTPVFSTKDRRSATPTPSTSNAESLLNLEVEQSSEHTRRLNVMCEGTHNTLSRRQLRAMTNVNRIIDEQRRPTGRQLLLEANRLYIQQLDHRVKVFLDSLEKLKKKEAEKELLRKLRIKETFD